MNKNHFYILIFFAMVTWGISWVNGKIVGAYMGANELVFLRYLISAISSCFLLIFFKLSFKIDKRTLFLVIAASILLAIYTRFFFLGTNLGTASLGGAFVTTLVPINTFLLVTIFYGKKLYKRDVFALFLGIVGVMMIVGVWHLQAKDIFKSYNLYFMLAAIIWPVITIISSYSKKINPVVFSFYMYFFVAIFSSLFVDFSSLSFNNTDSWFWGNMLFMSIVSTSLATSFYFVGVIKLGSAQVSSFMFLVPFSSIFFGALILKESISIFMIVGTLLTICAVYILNNIGIFKKYSS